MAPRRPHGMEAASHCVAAVIYFALLSALPVAWEAVDPWREPAAVAGAGQDAGEGARPQDPRPNSGESVVGVDNVGAASPQMKQLLDEADKLFHAGKLPEAKTAAEAVLKIDPENADAHVLRGVALKAEGKFAEAATAIQHAIAVIPENPNLWSILGQIQGELTQFAEAEQSLSKAIELKQPPQASFFYNRGFVRFKLDRFEDAAADFTAAIELKQMEGAALARVCEMAGLSLQKAGKVVEALPYFNSAVQVQPDNAEIQLNRALAFQSLGAQKFTDGSAAEFARKGFEEVLRLAPKSNQAHFGRAIALQTLGDHVTAIEELNIVLESEPQNDLVIWKRGMSHQNLGHYEQAAADYRRAAELDPADRSAVELLVRIHVAQGRFDEALAYCRKLLATEPQNPGLLQSQTALLFLSGAVDEAAAARRQSTSAALAEKSPALQLVAGGLALLPPADAEIATQAEAAIKELADGPAKHTLASLISVLLQLQLGQSDAAKARLESIDATQLKGPLLAVHQLCQAELAAAAGDAAAARKAIEECSPWFEEFCPEQFAEGQPETFSADWTSRSVFGLLYRDAKKRIAAE